jgi:hypothetical protein
MVSLCGSVAISGFFCPLPDDSWKNAEHWLDDTSGINHKQLEEIFSHYKYVHHDPNVYNAENKPGPQIWEAGD